MTLSRQWHPREHAFLFLQGWTRSVVPAWVLRGAQGKAGLGAWRPGASGAAGAGLMGLTMSKYNGQSCYLFRMAHFQWVNGG